MALPEIKWVGIRIELSVLILGLGFVHHYVGTECSSSTYWREGDIMAGVLVACSMAISLLLSLGALERYQRRMRPFFWVQCVLCSLLRHAVASRVQDTWKPLSLGNFSITSSPSLREWLPTKRFPATFVSPNPSPKLNQNHLFKTQT